MVDSSAESLSRKIGKRFERPVEMDGPVRQSVGGLRWACRVKVLQLQERGKERNCGPFIDMLLNQSHQRQPDSDEHPQIQLYSTIVVLLVFVMVLIGHVCR